MREKYLSFSHISYSEVRKGNIQHFALFEPQLCAKNLILGKDLRRNEKTVGLYRVANCIQHTHRFLSHPKGAF